MTDTDLLIQNLRRENEWLKKRIELAEAEKRLREVGADDGDYINRTALLHDIEQSVIYTAREKITSAEMRGAHKIIERIKCAPAVEPIYIYAPTKSEFKRMAVQMDYVPVVRCKDCEWSYNEISGLCCSHGVCVDCEVPPNFYCAEGKRKENSNDLG